VTGTGTAQGGRRRRPPKRRCDACGGDYYGWREHDVCGRCKRAGELDSGVGALVREARAERARGLTASLVARSADASDPDVWLSDEFGF